MTDYQKYINALRKCAKEHENDRTFTGHIIVSDLCKDTANLLEELEQETILDKIRTEIKAMFPPSGSWMHEEGHEVEHTVCEVLVDVLQVIDKYKESEYKE